MSPPSWRQEIVETVDIDILAQVLNSGTLDMDYFGKILEFALVTLRKLSAPLIEDQLQTNHQKFLKELEESTQDGENTTALFAALVVKGLQFVLRQIKKLKGEISKARIKLLEPLIKGPAGFEYLRSSFSNRYGPPIEAPISLPLVKQWLSSVMLVAEQEWDDHLNSLSSLRLSTGVHSLEKAPITLRAGGSSLRISDPPNHKTNACWFCGRLFLLNASGYQPSEMEDIASKSVTKLFKLLDNVEDVGMPFSLEFPARFSWQGCQFTSLRKRSEGRRLAGEHPGTCWCHSTTGKLVEAMEDLLAVATVSARVHGSCGPELL
ncbi:hypothetical protein HAX54_012151 [Datura stramonium]|uniref:Uncharacterized protein n=1 Tax=Datura stramonium TaxID=4076 RepID=A0ABS8RXC0_DATST|nr:hypothetical protein [Datura stramonium]